MTRRLSVTSDLDIVRDALASARDDAPPPGAGDRALRAALAAAAGASVVVATKAAGASVVGSAAGAGVATSTSAAGAKGVATMALAKWSVALAVAASSAVVVVGVEHASRPPPQVALSASVAPAPVDRRPRIARRAEELGAAFAATALPAPVVVAEVPGQRPSLPKDAPRAAASSRPAASPRPLAEELTALSAIRDGVASDPVLALVGIARYRAAHPSGALLEEVEALEVEALAARGDREAVARAGRSFLARRPTSVHAPHVRELVGRAVVERDLLEDAVRP